MARPRKTREELQLSGLITKKKEYQSYGSNKQIALPMDSNLYPPRSFQKETKEAWEMITIPLLNMQILTELDLPEMYGLFETYDEYVKASKVFKDISREINPMDPERFEVLLKVSKWKHNTFDLFSRVASKFGLTPTERTKLQIPDVSEPEDVFSELLKSN